MTCPGCGADARSEGRFCPRCGARLGSACPSCGAASEPGDVFCAGCGLALAPEATATASSRPATTERRLVSVLFCDLVGFTTLSETRDAEEVRDLLSSYFDRCRSIVESYGGTIEKFIGDAVMAVWGTPSANEDDAERTVRAALDLVDAVGALGARISAPQLQARAGVLTGEAVVNLGAQGQGMVAGDLVNTASRLQSVAEPGTVVVGEGTFRAAARAVAYQDLGEVQLKGKQEPVHAWRALRVVAQRRGEGGGSRPEPPFTGRLEELRRLKDLLQSVGRERRPTLASITGIPGIGKSRLAWELQKYVDGLAEGIYWHQGRCPSYGQGIAFWALAEMVRMRAGIAEAEEPALALPKLEAVVQDCCADPEEAAWVMPRLAHLCGLDEAPPGGREELFSAWRTFFERISERGTTVLVFEDLQWADGGLLDFIESILEWSRTKALLVLTLSRPELSERRPTWGAHQRNFVSLHLDPLADAAMDELLRGLIPGLPEEVARRLRERAEGVPLFAVETVRSLVDQGVLEERDGVYLVVGDASALQVPESLHALIASRLDGLPALQRSLLQDAAVLGKTFTVAALASVSAKEPAAVEEQLRDLARKELLSVDVDPRSPERGQYGFVQGLIRDVAYGTIARRDRADKHLAAAEFFEASGEDELSGVVATHYLEAYRATPEGPEADAIVGKARDHLVRAGKRARSLGSPDQALQYLERALEVTSSPAAQAALHDLAGEAAQYANRLELAVAHDEAALRQHHDEGELAAEVRTTARLVRALAGLDRYAEAIERGEGAFQVLGEEGEPAALGELADSMANTLSRSGNAEAALRWAETTLQLAARLEDPTLLMRGLLHRAWAAFERGRHAEAAILCRAAAELAASDGSLLDQTNAGLFLGMFMLSDDPRGAIAEWLRDLEVARRAGLRSFEVLHLGNIAEEAVSAGEWSLADRVLAEFREVESSDLERNFCESIATRLMAFRGQVEEAQRSLEGWATKMEETQYLSGQMTYVMTRALVALAAGQLEVARTEASRVTARESSGLNSLPSFLIAARCSLWLGDPALPKQILAQMGAFRGRVTAAIRLTLEAGVAALEGRTADAHSTYAEAQALWSSLDLRFELGLCQLDMALLLGTEHEATQRAIWAARRTFEELGALPFLARLPQLELRQLAEATALTASGEPAPVSQPV